MKVCNSCGILKNEEEFNYRYKYLGIRHPTCKECQKGFRKNWYEGKAKQRHLDNVHERKRRMRDEAREWVYQYLLTHSCVDCGERDPRVLTFDHVRGKNADISRMVADGAPIWKIEMEISLCKVRCSNCHLKKTMNDRGWFRGRK
jgi:hypothetical protein